MPPKDPGPTAASLSEQFARLPVELLIEIASCLGQLTDEYSISDGPRTAQASAFLLALMSQSHHLRQAARPMYWSEVHVSSKSRWKKLSLLLKGNRFKKTPPILDIRLIETLDLSLDQPAEAIGGVDAGDLAQMTMLGELKHLRVRVGKGVSFNQLCGAMLYYEHLGNLGRSLATAGASSHISRLSIYSPTPQSSSECLLLAVQFPRLQHLLLDNIKSPTEAFVTPSLPNLQSLSVRNASNMTFDVLHGFDFVLTCKALSSLSLQGCPFHKDFLLQVLTAQKESLTKLEIGTPVLEPCINRWELYIAHETGQRSLETGWYVPIHMLEDPTRIGDEAAVICTNVTKLSLGGLLCVSSDLLQTLNEPGRASLSLLRLHDAGPQRPQRPSGNRDAAREQALLQTRPAGISPQDMLDAFDDGFRVATLDIRGMGPEWDFQRQEPAIKLTERCNQLGISLIC